MITTTRDGDFGRQHLGCGRSVGPPIRSDQDGSENRCAHAQSRRPCDESSDQDAVAQPVLGLRWLLRCDLAGQMPGEIVGRRLMSTVRTGQRVGPSFPARPRRKLRSPELDVNVFDEALADRARDTRPGPRPSWVQRRRRQPIPELGLSKTGASPYSEWSTTTGGSQFGPGQPTGLSDAGRQHGKACALSIAC